MVIVRGLKMSGCVHPFGWFSGWIRVCYYITATCKRSIMTVKQIDWQVILSNGSSPDLYTMLFCALIYSDEMIIEKR